MSTGTGGNWPSVNKNKSNSNSSRSSSSLNHTSGENKFNTSEEDMIGLTNEGYEAVQRSNLSRVYGKGANSIRIGSVAENTIADLRAQGVYNRFENRWDRTFSRIPIIDPYTTLTGTKEYLFFVKPDLHLYENGSPNKELVDHSPFFSDAIDRYPRVAAQLQYSKSSGIDGGPLSPLLSNAIAGPLDLPGISADSIDTPQNVYGTKIQYRGTSYSSDEGFDFSLTFKDDKYLEIYMYFKMYDEYERMKWKGQVTPTKNSYRLYKNLHDQTAIYKFIVADDGMSLVYWARVMGTYPVSVPRETFGRLEPGEIQYDVNWHGFRVDDMNPAILSDFNNITKGYRSANSRGMLPLFDQSTLKFNPDWALCPYIMQRNKTDTDLEKMNKYYLLWSAVE